MTTPGVYARMTTFGLALVLGARVGENDSGPCGGPVDREIAAGLSWGRSIFTDGVECRTTNAMRGFFPFGKLRVRMTILETGR